MIGLYLTTPTLLKVKMWSVCLKVVHNEVFKYCQVDAKDYSQFIFFDCVYQIMTEMCNAGMLS